MSLKSAMAAATKKDSAVHKPLIDPMGEFPKFQHASMPEMEARLLELQADVINREELIAERERKLQFRERELNEREALLEAQRNVLASRGATHPHASSESAEDESMEMDALRKLKAELEAQETSIKEAREMIREREDYIEKCENDLVEKSMMLTEREARVEQREEDYETNASNAPPQD
ncbi:MAG: hypothetical protein ACLFVC_07660 [Opitutales bacterium]